MSEKIFTRIVLNVHQTFIFQRFINFEPHWFKKFAWAISNSFWRLTFKCLGIQTPTPPPRWTPVCFDRAFCKKRCSLLILKLASCCSEIRVSVCEYCCWSKFERSSNLICMLGTVTSNIKKQILISFTLLNTKKNYERLICFLSNETQKKSI